jgi:hypothetical protein
MTDREMLELAAKAAGIVLEFNDYGQPGYWSEWRGLPQWEAWNPLTDDGDEARLEAVLALNCVWFEDGVGVGSAIELFADHNNARQAARRRSGVRAAAEIGRKMP